MKGNGYMKINKKFVDELREKSGYTTKKFAEIDGISPEFYYAIMSNKNVSLRTIKALNANLNFMVAKVTLCLHYIV